MKNIYIIPTDKPSRLHEFGGIWFSHKEPTECFRNYEIYITFDEEINQQTKPCWCINTIKNTWDADLIYYQGSMPQYHYKGFKKIILTTDQDLIKDGVQAIDDEFLEWFVGNPTCENIEIEEIHYSDIDRYEIIIPKEEPKTNLERLPFPELVKEFAEYYKKVPLVEEHKQETLEEAAERIYREYPNNPLDKPDWRYNRDVNCFKKRKAFIAGAEWAAEKMYSEEDMKQFAEWLIKVNFNYTSNISDVFLIWNKQHKKK